MTQADTICCLRCRLCQLEPDTDMAQRNTMIYCGKLQSRRPINLHGCEAADGNTRWRGSGKGAVKVDGDKSRNATPVELAFLAAHYALLSFAALARLTGRSEATLKTMAQTHGLRRGRSEASKQRSAIGARAGRAARGQVLNAAQAAYVTARYATGDWPLAGGSNSGALLEERYRLQGEIVEAVAVLGARFEWKTLQKSIRWRSPGYRRYDAARRARRKSKILELEAV